jgi:hypothetical protein
MLQIYLHLIRIFPLGMVFLVITSYIFLVSIFSFPYFKYFKVFAYNFPPFSFLFFIFVIPSFINLSKGNGSGISFS